MKIFREMLKTFIFYFVGWIILYFIYAFGDLFLPRSLDNSIVWLAYVCLLMSIAGFILWYMKNRKYALFQGIRVKNVNPSFCKIFRLRLLSGVFIVIIVGFMEYAGIGFAVTPFYLFLYDILKNEALASRFSFGAVPVICVPNVFIISLFGLVYSITQLLLDKRLRIK